MINFRPANEFAEALFRDLIKIYDWEENGKIHFTIMENLRRLPSLKNEPQSVSS